MANIVPTLHRAFVFSQLVMWCVILPLLILFGEGPSGASQWLETVATGAGFLLVTYITALLELRTANKKAKAWDQLFKGASFIHDSLIPPMYGATTSSEVSKDKELDQNFMIDGEDYGDDWD